MPTIKVVLVSDTHGEHGSINIPDGEILIHAGDLTPSGKTDEIACAAAWLASLPHRHKIAIAGNHDWLFERDPRQARAILENVGVIYLQDQEINVRGLRIYRSPWQPEFMHWAFNIPRGQLSRFWDQIPPGLDILITHTPPHGVLDQRDPGGKFRFAPWEDEVPLAGSDHVGCEELLSAVERTGPRVHVFGHIHSGYGTKRKWDTRSYNAAICDEVYNPVHKPWVVEIDGEE